jgi:two-component system response regulator AtoC
MERNCTVLVIDDDDVARASLCEFLGAAGYRVRSARGGAEGLGALLGGSEIEAVLLDLVMPDVDGFEVLRRYRDQGGAAPVVVLSALSDAGGVVRAMKLGATDYLPKPFDVSELDLVLRRALEGPARRPPALDGRPSAETLRPPDTDGALGQVTLSSAMERVWALVKRIADTDVPVLIVGESGVGKDVVARRIHATSHRAGRTFVKINCAALPGELLESELFGHEKGAFTGAHAEKPGKFELAHKGTIFLDEIGEMDPRLQAKLLQVLQDEEFYRVGGKRPIKVDARVVVATNRDLGAAIQSGTFREDLYYRLNVVTIRVPSLRERKEDIGPLGRYFVDKYRRRYSGGLDHVPDEVMERFLAYDWPGNVRELENLVRRLVVLRDPAMVLNEIAAKPPALSAGRSLPPPAPAPAVPRPEELPAIAAGGAPALAAAPPAGGAVNGAVNGAVAAPSGVPLTGAALDDVPLKEVARRACRLAEREAILRALMRTGWNKRKAAKRLQISYKALLYKIKDCEIVDPRAAATIE